MKTFFKLACMFIIGVPVVALALANRSDVTLAFNPFASSQTTGGITLPLFLVILLAIAFGVLIGGVSTWFGRGKHRRAARLAREQAEQLRSQGVPTQNLTRVAS